MGELTQGMVSAARVYRLIGDAEKEIDKEEHKDKLSSYPVSLPRWWTHNL
jgi:hypothetical protein